MTAPNLRPMRADDANSVIALNAEVEVLTSEMDAARFLALFDVSSMKIVAERDGEILGFVFAMGDFCRYENPNFDWFRARIRSYLYVDRIVVHESSRGLGIGQLLYRHTFEVAQGTGARSVCAEINVAPPNPASLRFHAREGFVEIGRRKPGGGKVLSMQMRPLPDS